MSETTLGLEIGGLEKRYGSVAAVSSIDLAVRRGELLSILGPSGSGKTSLLRIIAGLEQAERGTLRIDGRDAHLLAPRERRIGLVFQNYALFRHMNVADNIAFGLTVRKHRDRPPRAAIAARVEELLTLMQLPGLGKRFPAQLSGGQRQRVALARALAIEPALLLLDEPFGALDARVRGELGSWLRELQRRLGITTLLVTHDQDEALELADRVAILNEGRLEQVGTPAEVYEHPASPFVTEFLGAANRFDAQVSGGRVLMTGVPLPVALSHSGRLGDGEVTLFIRPHEIRIAENGEGERAIVRDISAVGPRRDVELLYRGITLRWELRNEIIETLRIRRGDEVPIEFARIIAFPRAA